MSKPVCHKHLHRTERRNLKQRLFFERFYTQAAGRGILIHIPASGPHMQDSAFVAYAPAEPLKQFVRAYWFVRDWQGLQSGIPIRTSPIAGAVMTVNLGRPNATGDGRLAPQVSLLGLQTKSREWHSWDKTYFVMVMLSIPGLVRLFPGVGSTAFESLVSLDEVLGDGCTTSLHARVETAWMPERVCNELNGWLLSRLDRTRIYSDVKRVLSAYDALRDRRTVLEAATPGCLSSSLRAL